jgi:adhesin HecA-like repeat protein
VVANPYGITCSGCGFINTDRVTLTTGMPNVAADGSLTGFTVNRGDVLITGTGANVSAQQIFDIVTRSVVVNGRINANTLGLFTGNNTWNYSSRTITDSSVPGSGPVPTYAIDSTVMGGMYAGRINIIATEAGVGVRMLGQVAASADDFILSSAGKIEIQSAISAARNLSMTSTSATNTQDLYLNGTGASLSANHDLLLSANGGDVKLNGGALYAGNNLTLSSATLNDFSATAATRFAGANNTITTTGVSSIDGSTWGAGQALSGSFGSLVVGAGGATIYANTTLGLNATNNLSLAAAAVKSVGDMTLSASQGVISTTAGATEGIETTTGNLSLTAGNGLSNAGTVTADLGNVTARVNGVITNSGTIHAKSVLDLADMTNGGSEDITNSGTLISDGSLTAKAGDFTNQLGGNVQGTTGTTLNATALNNAGTFTASNTAGQAGNFVLANLANNGILQSSQDLNLNVTNTLSNSGKLLATHNLAINSGAAALNIINIPLGVIQAGNALTMTGANATLGSQLGTVLGNTVGLSLSDLNNSGTLQSQTTMTLAISNGLTNSGTLLAQTSLNSHSATLTNSGTLEANQGALIATTGDLTNTGNLIASNSAGSSATIDAGTLNNSSGVIQSAGDLAINISGGALTNAGAIGAGNNLAVTSSGNGLTFTNQSGGYLQSAGMLTINALIMNNSAGGFLLGDQLSFSTASLTNDGTIQGGTSASNIGVGGTLTNSGTLSLANSSSGSGTITANTINNSGTLQSQGDATLNVLTALSNSGQLLTAGGLTVRGVGNAYTVIDTGRIQSGGLMDVKGAGGGNGVNVFIGNGSVLLGNTMDMNASSLSLGVNGMLTSTGDMTLAVNSLAFAGTTSRIVGDTFGNGTVTINLGNSFSNNGAIFSGGDLNFSAPSITNTITGGISALNNLTLNAGGTIFNAGALYGGSQITISTPRDFINSAILSAPQGTVNSGGSISMIVGSFTNNSLINANGDIAISAGTLLNEVAGGDTRAFNPFVISPAVMVLDNSYYQFPDQYDNQFWEQLAYRTQFYAGGTPGFKPQIISNSGTLTLQNFDTATNVGGVISAPTVNLLGRPGSTFTNNDLSLNQEDYKRTYEIFTHYIALGPATYVDHQIQNDTGLLLQNTTQISSIGAGIFATNLNAGGFSLVNAGSPLLALISSTSASGTSANSLQPGTSGTAFISGVSGTTTVNGAPAISFGGLVIALPTNPNGFFVLTQNPDAKYLVETNPLFALGANFVGSDYLASQFGYNPDPTIRYLGDSNYEAYLIQQQLIAQIGKDILNGYANEADLIKGLMDQAVAEGKQEGFVFGQALTTDQIANLKSDIVWMVETVVAGQKVLVPVVYLAANTKNSIDKGAVIAGTNVNLNLASLTNTGGTISGSKSLNIASSGDITNISGTIKGGDVSLSSANGSVINETFTSSGPSKVSSGDAGTPANNVLGKTATIEATNNLNIVAGKDIVSKGADISAGNNANLNAGGDITLSSVEKQTHTTALDVHEQGGYKTVTSVIDQKNENVGSTLSVGGNLNAKAGQDVNIEASKVNVDKNASIDAGRDVNIKAVADTSQTKLDTRTASALSESTEKTTTDKTTGAAASVNIGNSLTVASGGDTTIKGSDITVGKDLNVANVGGNLNVTTFENTTNVQSKKSTTTFFGGVAKSDASATTPSPGTSAALSLFGHTSESTNISATQNQGSQIAAGGNVNAGVKGDVNIIGSKISNRGDVNVAAGGNVNVLAAQDKTKASSKSSSIMFGVTGSASTTEVSGGLSLDIANKSGSLAETTAQVSELKSGGNINLNAGGDYTEQGTNVIAGGNIGIAANSVKSLAAKNTETKTGDALDINVSLGGVQPITSGQVPLNSNPSLNLGVSVTSTSSQDSATSAKASSYTSGGDTTFKAYKGDATFEGTNVNAKGSIAATAQEGSINVLTANDSTSSNKKNTTAEVNIGITSDATVYGTGSGSSSISNSASSTQKAASFTAGKNIDLTAQKDVNLAGTQFKAGDNASLTAKEGAINFAEARDNTSSASSSVSANAGVAVNITGKSGGASGGASVMKTNEVSSIGKAGSINAGNVQLNSGVGGITLVGTNIAAENNVGIKTAGNFNFEAVEDTRTRTAKGGSGQLGVLVQPGGGGLDASFSITNEFEQSSTKTAGSLSAKNLTIATGTGVRLEGTQVEAEDASINTGTGQLVLESAVSTSTKHIDDVSASVLGMSGKSGSGGFAGLKVNIEDSKQVTNQNASLNIGGQADIKAAGGIDIKGSNISGVGSVINAGTLDTHDAKTTVEQREDVNQSSGTSLDVKAIIIAPGKNMLGGKKAKTPVDGTNKEAQVAKPPGTAATTSTEASSAPKKVNTETQVAKPPGTASTTSPEASPASKKVSTETQVAKPPGTTATTSPEASSAPKKVNTETQVAKPPGTTATTSPEASPAPKKVSTEAQVAKPPGTAGTTSPEASPAPKKVSTEAQVAKPSGTAATTSPEASPAPKKVSTEAQLAKPPGTAGTTSPEASPAPKKVSTEAQVAKPPGTAGTTSPTASPTPEKVNTETQIAKAPEPSGKDRTGFGDVGLNVNKEIAAVSGKDRSRVGDAGLNFKIEDTNKVTNQNTALNIKEAPVAAPEPRSATPSTVSKKADNTINQKEPVKIASVDEKGAVPKSLPESKSATQETSTTPSIIKSDHITDQEVAVAQKMSKDLTVSENDINSRFATTLPTALGQGALAIDASHKAAIARELPIIAQQKALLQALPNLSASERQNTMRQIDALEAQRINTKLESEVNFAQQLRGEAVHIQSELRPTSVVTPRLPPMAIQDPMFREKSAASTTAIQASGSYLGQLGAARGTLGEVNGLRVQREHEATQLEELRKQPNGAKDAITELENSVANHDRMIQQKLRDANDQIKSAEENFTRSMLPYSR